MSNLVADVCNEALDAAGIDFTIGDIEEGTKAAQVCLRHYKQVLMQLLRAAHWDMARTQSPLVLLADANCYNNPSMYADYPNEVGHLVPQGFRFLYAYPVDCMKARFVLWNHNECGTNVGPPGNISLPNTPLYTQENQSPNNITMRPAKFIVATDSNYPPPGGTVDWTVQGISPTSRTVILTNAPYAKLVYTALMLYPSVWDSLFRSAMVAYLASLIALPLAKDKKMGMEMRNQNIAILKQKLDLARLTNGNEGTQNADISVDWLSIRGSGSRFGGSGNQGYGQGETVGYGVFGYGYDSCSLGNAGAY